MGMLNIEKLAGAVGAEVMGADPERLASDDAIASPILDALEAHGVLVFRGLHLDPAAQVAFCRGLGEIDCSYEGGPTGVLGVYWVSLDPAKNSRAEYLRGTFDWHIDGCISAADEYPQRATLLTAVAVAENGGETEFASTYAAYDLLSEEEKERFGSLRVVHSLEASQRFATPDPSPEVLARWRSRPTSVHPLVWTHRSGRRSLVLGVTADHVVGMDPDEGRAFLDELLSRATRPERVYRHEWSVGDAVIWDNRGVLHRATPYDAGSPRAMLRTTILGDEPIR